MDEAGKTFASGEDAAHPHAGISSLRRRGALDAARVAELLDAWRAVELDRFSRDWRTLSYAELEDLYSETTIALLARPYRREHHLRLALREGMQYRALNAYNAALRHREIIAESEQGVRALQAARSREETPEQIALAHQDELLLNELVRELTPFQQQVFDLTTEGKRYKKIAAALGVSTAQARRATRACESKGRTFLLLYESGRLCGYRTETIKAIQAGRTASEDLAELAIAHLENCPRCRAEHRTNGARLRQRFNEQASALMPPALIVRWSLFTQSSRARAIARFLPDTGAGREVLRERAGTVIATGGVSAKLAVTALIGAAVVAGGISASHLQHQPTRKARPHLASPRATQAAVAEQETLLFSHPQIGARTASAKRTARHKPRRSTPRHTSGESASGGQSEPGGFGQPGTVVEASKPTPAAEPSKPEEQHGGGPFGP
jgi:hypothetical protein